MTEEELRDWSEFEKTGRIDAYLRYRKNSREAADIEVGEEFGTGENRRDCHQGHKIR